MRDLTVVDEEWLVELAPHYYQFRGGGIKQH
jgi:ATP-dependent RNA helicase DDX35